MKFLTDRRIALGECVWAIEAGRYGRERAKASLQAIYAFDAGAGSERGGRSGMLRRTTGERVF